MPLTILCPKTAQGELVAMVSFVYVKDQPSMVTPLISVSVYVSAAGTEKRSGRIERLSLQRWQERWQAGLSVVATGNVHLRPSGKIWVENEAGQKVGEFLIAEGDPTYPGSERGYVGVNPGLNLAAGRYRLRAQLSSKELVLEASRFVEVKADGTVQLEK